MILIVDLNWKKDSLGYYEFVLPIVSIVKSLDEFKVKHYLEVTHQDTVDCTSIILSGTALKDTATLRQPEKFEWLKETETPVLGICAGMETIGLVFDARLFDSVEIGMTEIKVLKKNPLLSGDLKAYSLHSICVEPSGNFEVWAKSAKCIQAISHERKPIYAVLFHPEVRNPQIIRNFVNQAKKDHVR